jgi:thiol-disulfide isomerase/thioredoxin/uncharacterized membrane protein
MRQRATPVVMAERIQMSIIRGAVLALVLSARLSGAALVPSVSSDLRGQPVAAFHAETIEGKTFTSEQLAGRLTLVNFFASWCPACGMELEQLKTLRPELDEMGVSVVTVLVDPVETPDTVGEARQMLARDPLPFTVVLMTPAMREVFRYEGFPATYTIGADGVFGTTLFGYQPAEQIRKTTAEAGLQIGGPRTQAPPREAASGEHHAPWEGHPFVALLPAGWEQWHPLVVHFPVTILVLEALCLSAVALRPRKDLQQISTWLLWAAVASLVPTIYTGIHDAGLDLGPGSPFVNGLRDRIGHAFQLKSSVSLHVLFGLAAASLAVGRLVWRTAGGTVVLEGRSRFVFTALALLGVWILFGGTQIGGAISHH